MGLREGRDLRASCHRVHPPKEAFPTEELISMGIILGDLQPPYEEWQL